MPPPPMQVSYPLAVHILNDSEVHADLGEACQRLAQSTVRLMQVFDSVATQLHTIDMQGLTGPTRPTWNSINKDFRKLVWNSRNNAGYISGRLKIFCGTVLPLISQNLTGGSHRSHTEKLQVLQSFMSISADHASLTRGFAGDALSLSSRLCHFHSEFARFTGTRMASGHKELRDLYDKVLQLDASVKQLFEAVGKLVNIDVSFIVFSAFRSLSSLGRPSKAKITRQKPILNGLDLATVGNLYDQVDGTRNELVHANYAAQVSHRQTDVLTTTRTTVSSLVTDQMFGMESILSFFLSIWAMLQTDCMEILTWLQRPPQPGGLPFSVAAYLETGSTLYMSLSSSMDRYIGAIDPSQFSNSS